MKRTFILYLKLGKLICSVEGWMGCSILLDSLEEGRQLKLREHDGLIAAECTSQANDYEAVNVGEWKKSQRYVLSWPSVGSLPGTTELLVEGYLDDVRDAVTMGDHDAFL